MISKISCDTENWRNYEENSALHQSNNITFYKKRYIACLFILFWSNKFSFVEQNIFISKNINNGNVSKL